MTVAIDTNIVVRYLIWDDPIQAQAAATLLEAGDPIWISTVVLCETVWVLKGAHGYPRGQIANAIRGLVAPAHIRVEDVEAMSAGLSMLEAGGDFADGCSLNVSQRAKAHLLLTFDKRLARIGGGAVRLLSSV